MFETTGDGVYAAFAHPPDALEAGLAGQALVAAEEWRDLGDVRIRVSLHLGPVKLVGTNYVGHALFRCAHILAMAHGGQTLMPSTMAEAVHECLPSGDSRLALGRHLPATGPWPPRGDGGSDAGDASR